MYKQYSILSNIKFLTKRLFVVLLFQTQIKEAMLMFANVTEDDADRLANLLKGLIDLQIMQRVGEDGKIPKEGMKLFFGGNIDGLVLRKLSGMYYADGYLVHWDCVPPCSILSISYVQKPHLQ